MGFSPKGVKENSRNSLRPLGLSNPLPTRLFPRSFTRSISLILVNNCTIRPCNCPFLRKPRKGASASRNCFFSLLQWPNCPPQPSTSKRPPTKDYPLKTQRPPSRYKLRFKFKFKCKFKFKIATTPKPHTTKNPKQFYLKFANLFTKS